MTYRREEYPQAVVDLARRRVKDLLTYFLLSTNPISKLVESAYLQGIVDAVETGVMIPKPEVELIVGRVVE